MVHFTASCIDMGGRSEGNNHACSFMIEVSGIIDAVMLSRVRFALTRMPSGDHAPNLQISSEGGSVSTAIEIGRLMREHEFNVIVPDGSTCASACVLILAGGLHRAADGRIGIHRPFLETPRRQVTAAEVRAATERVLANMRAYLRDVNVPERLADEMMAVPSDRMRWLTRTEIDAFGLNAADTVWQETRDLNEANRYGLTRLVYMQRRTLAREQCTVSERDSLSGFPTSFAMQQYDQCRERIFRTGR